MCNKWIFIYSYHVSSLFSRPGMSDSECMDCSTSGLPVTHHLPLFVQVRWWCHPAISSTVFLFFCPQSFPASGTFPIGWLFASGDQNTGASASASVLPMSIQGWFPLQLTGLISLLSSGFSGVFSSTKVWRHRFFGALPFLYSSSQNCMWTLGSP